MPQACSICVHPERPGIDQALAGGDSLRTIAQRTQTSRDALQRHKAHIPAALATAREAEAVANADDLLGQVRALQAKALDLLTKAEAMGDYRTALSGVREARACLELLMEVSGELDRRNVVNVTVSAEWLQLRTVILTALAPYPEAAQAVAGRLQSLEGGTGHAPG